jgi:hypothetical protein
MKSNQDKQMPLGCFILGVIFIAFIAYAVKEIVNSLIQNI